MAVGEVESGGRAVEEAGKRPDGRVRRVRVESLKDEVAFASVEGVGEVKR